MIAAGEFEALLRRLYVEEEGTAILELKPSYTYGEELRADEAARLAEIGAAWSDADRAENLALNEKLLAWQQTPDTPEQLATLPVLPLSEVSPEPHLAGSEISTVNGVTLLFHRQPCRNIQHIRLYFRLTDFTLPELAQIGTANLFFGKLSTEHYAALELQQKLKNTFGRFEISVSVSAKEGELRTCTPMLIVSLSVLKEKRAEAEELLREVLFRTDFRQKELLRERLIQLEERNKQFGIAAGHALGISVASSRYSALNTVGDALSGLTMVKEIRALVSDFDERYDEFASLLERIRQETLCRARMTVSLTAAEEADLSGLIGAFPAGKAVPEAASYCIRYPEKVGYAIPAQIGFAVQSWMLPEGGHAYDSTMRVAAKILSLSYLWNVVRVQGGAYGTGFSVRSDGSVFTYSYRDPSPQASLEANRGFSGFIRAFCESDEPLDKFIISTVADEEPLLSPRDEGALADTLYFTGRTIETLRRFRRDLLGCTREALLEQCRIWDEFAEKGTVCIVAADSVLKQSPGLTILD
jgi:Zn-dependent M16 (insulinase) family peptidase